MHVIFVCFFFRLIAQKAQLCAESLLLGCPFREQEFKQNLIGYFCVNFNQLYV